MCPITRGRLGLGLGLDLGLCTLFGTGKQMSDSVSPFATGRRGAREIFH